VQAPDGYLYGTTSSGGPATSCPDFLGCGVIFRTDGAGNLTVLHVLTESEGAQPSRLLQASDGNFYGTAAYYGVGPATGCGFSHSCGTVFKMDAAGHLTVIHYFQGGADGQTPTGGLIEATDGNLYGTTYAGVYRITPAGTFTIVHTFDKVRDGAGVNGPLVQGPDGSLYGTTSFGGTFDGGTIFKVDGAGNLVVLHHFSFPEGWEPAAGLILGSDGNFYGTAERGGAADAGVIFRIDAAGNYTLLYSFGQYASDGFRPVAPLVQGSDGSFYGTAPNGGLPIDDSSRSGVVFKLDAARNVSVLQTFTGPNGATPLAGLARVSDGKLYGTTVGGGTGGKGVVFSVDPSPPGPIASFSFSPSTVLSGAGSTGTVTLSAPAPAGGTVVALSNLYPGILTVPASVTVPGGKQSATFSASTGSTSGTANAKIYASIAGAGISAGLTITAGATLDSLTLSPASVTGGSYSNAVVTLSAPAPPSGLLVTFTSSDVPVASFPQWTDVQAGATTGSAVILTSPVTASTSVTITAYAGDVTKTATLTVTPATGGLLGSLSLNPTFVKGGAASTGVVTLNGVAPDGGASVTLSSSNTSFATVPASVTVQAGTSSVSFSLATKPVHKTRSVTISASYGGVRKTATLTVTR
jgi:uncharacterized repeat protein (TIGR03803 family)